MRIKKTEFMTLYLVISVLILFSSCTSFLKFDYCYCTYVYISPIMTNCKILPCKKYLSN